MEVYNSRHTIDPKKMYKVDIFSRRWKGIDNNISFVPGGRYFITTGKMLQSLLTTQSTDFEEEEETKKNHNKKNVCFLNYIEDRNALIEKYKRLFFYYYKTNKSGIAFTKLCTRVRKERYANRLTFNFMVVKRVGCNVCKNKCVYDALKKFYLMDTKCIAEVDRLMLKENGFN
ncbi:late expression factor 2 [Diatraea saccharalis granulovirus]|uniref:Late expression factor 2 n=1 Tax=Diatraea saccharalis granulovirus TaxID=1675862 RepID=A0A0R7EYS9_9BBAC|nr:late expression factor 2 [Diatraea saccharalis granulovirus]AKN80716.1 late expression factor 2 [Diatraea saccharalis granulovirus]